MKMNKLIPNNIIPFNKNSLAAKNNLGVNYSLPEHRSIFNKTLSALGYLTIGTIISLLILLVCSLTVKVFMDDYINSLTSKEKPALINNSNETPTTPR